MSILARDNSVLLFISWSYLSAQYICGDSIATTIGTSPHQCNPDL